MRISNTIPNTDYDNKKNRRMWNMSNIWVVHTNKLKSRIIMAKAGFY